MTFSQPDGITVRDGQVWITEESGNKVDEISLTATVFTLALPQAHSGPEQITLGPSDTLWVSEYTGHRVARVTIPTS
jgi:streptogramin lyase